MKVERMIWVISAFAVPRASSAAFLGPRASSIRNAASNKSDLNLFSKLFSSNSQVDSKYPIIADESVMSQKAHGTSEKPVMKDLRWKCDYDTADRICNFNRHYAEYAGYWTSTSFLQSIKDGKESEPINFYDSVTGKLLFKAPVGRTMQEFLLESQKHGWPSFRDEETNWEHVRVLKNGECISTSGTHLGHNLPDRTGNRYCINLVSVAGQPAEGEENSDLKKEL
jgi:peptide methionine sulfoxide reductase MsrB